MVRRGRRRVRINLDGFVDETGFHPIRSKDPKDGYNRALAGDEGRGKQQGALARKGGRTFKGRKRRGKKK